jgi:phosphomannomutase/phosphoglucomutase
MTTLSCFKAYDIRGSVPDELNDDIAYRLGRAFADEFSPRSVIVGRDIRQESPSLAAALARGLNDGGADVVDIGLCGTEEVYFQTFHRQADGGIMVTASHNPKGFNGMKLVRSGSRPISGDSGLFALRDRVRVGNFADASVTGRTTVAPDKGAYIDHLLGYVEPAALRPLRIVGNPGNGGAGPIIRLLQERLPFEFSLIQETPDGTFPNGVPNPLLPENREATARAVLDNKADFGIAWDGDFDRCFLFDEQGQFIEGYYIVGLLAAAFLARNPGEKIIHDPRLTWNTRDIVLQAGGIPVQSKTGHAFIKERMRSENAVYGGEMSAHHYFRDFAYCDSGMIPWLLVAELISRSGRPLSKLVGERMAAYPCSGEINYRVTDVVATLARVVGHFTRQNPERDHTDGISMEFPDWRFNLRSSNTEPLLRLNVEARADATAVAHRVTEIEMLINPHQ